MVLEWSAGRGHNDECTQWQSALKRRVVTDMVQLRPLYESFVRIEHVARMLQVSPWRG